MNRRRLKPLTQEEWREFASTMKATLKGLRDMYGTLLSTSTVAKCKPAYLAIRRAQSAWSRAETICAEQHGWDFAESIFHGNGWVYHA